MYSVFLKAKHSMLFAKAFSMDEAKAKVAEEFQRDAAYFYADVYHQESRRTFFKFRGGDWREKREIAE